MDKAAAALGLFVGQKATDAVALVPELVLADADPAADAAALDALADWCARFSPAVALDPPDGLFLDITGVAHLWGGEAAMAADLTARLAKNGLPIRTAIAGTSGAAWALAHFGNVGAIVPPGDEAAASRPCRRRLCACPQRKALRSPGWDFSPSPPWRLCRATRSPGGSARK